MSGFVSVFQGDGAPIERALLESLTDFLTYRGPDAQGVWADRSVGMGHALLCTTHEYAVEQPASLDARFWIVADVRLDGREELIGELKLADREARSNAPDCELILDAYAAWGTACLDRLRGDYSFALWDAGHQRLFCARDHFGIKPFYYAQLGENFLCSNTLNCIRLHPRVSGSLDDAAIGDFLLFGLNYDNATTSFRDIKRLPPAHSLTVSPRGLHIWRYWTPPTGGCIRYSTHEEYLENFQSILKTAVKDRLRTDRPGILLSGGLDSSAVAAVAKEVAGRSAPSTEIMGYTFVYKWLIPDREGDYASEVSEFLRIPVKFIAMDEAQPFARLDDPKRNWPEPVENPFLAAMSDAYLDISVHSRVLLSGEGSDNLMDFQMWPYVRDLRRRGRWQELLTDVANYLWVRPFPWRGMRARILRLVRKDPGGPVYPNWLASDFGRSMKLEARWKEQNQLAKSWRAHPIHPRAHGSLSLPQWTHIFEQGDVGATGCLVETCYPFLDLRMVNYLLAIPPFPWFFKKRLLREAMAGRLPERVRTRPKTPLQGDPILAKIQRAGTAPWKGMSLVAELDRYVDRSAVQTPNGRMNAEQASSDLRPYCLNIWLQSARRIRYNAHAKANNGSARKT